MPDEPKTTSSSARSQSMRWNDTPSSPPSSTSSSAAAVLAPDDTQSASTSGRHAGTGAGTQQGPPSWWDPPPTIHADKRYKDQVCVCLPAYQLQLETMPWLVPSSSDGTQSGCKACSKLYMQPTPAQRHLAQTLLQCTPLEDILYTCHSMPVLVFSNHKKQPGVFPCHDQECARRTKA